MNRSKDFQPKSRFGPVGIGVMVLFHLLVGYALVSGLAGKTMALIKKPMDATIISEIKLPPPPPPPPPKKIIRQEPPKAPPPPRAAYVPPPTVTPPANTAPAITAVQNTEPVAPPPAAPPAAPAPQAPPGPVAAPQKAPSSDIAVACPKQVRPEVPRKALNEGISGVVVAEVRIKNGLVTDVRFVSGPRVFQSAVRAAVMRYECLSSGDTEIVAMQEFTFKID